MIGSLNGYDYWHIEFNIQKNPSDMFSILKAQDYVTSLKARIYKDGVTDISNSDGWDYISESGRYVLNKTEIPGFTEATWALIEIQ